jgi:hypothetical protein
VLPTLLTIILTSYTKVSNRYLLDAQNANLPLTNVHSQSIGLFICVSSASFCG